MIERIRLLGQVTEIGFLYKDALEKNQIRGTESNCSIHGTLPGNMAIAENPVGAGIFGLLSLQASPRKVDGKMNE